MTKCTSSNSGKGKSKGEDPGKGKGTGSGYDSGDDFTFGKGKFPVGPCIVMGVAPPVGPLGWPTESASGQRIERGRHYYIVDPASL